MNSHNSQIYLLIAALLAVVSTTSLAGDKTDPVEFAGTMMAESGTLVVTGVESLNEGVVTAMTRNDEANTAIRSSYQLLQAVGGVFWHLADSGSRITYHLFGEMVEKIARTKVSDHQ
jgi:hypothetical protein